MWAPTPISFSSFFLTWQGLSNYQTCSGDYLIPEVRKSVEENELQESKARGLTQLLLNGNIKKRNHILLQRGKMMFLARPIEKGRKRGM